MDAGAPTVNMDAAIPPVGPGRPSLVSSPAHTPPARHSLLDQLARSSPAEGGQRLRFISRPRGGARGVLAGLSVAAVGAAALSGIVAWPWPDPPHASAAPPARAVRHLPAPEAASSPAPALAVQAARIEEVSATPAVSSASTPASELMPARGVPQRGLTAAAGKWTHPPRGRARRPTPAAAHAAPRDPDVEVVAALMGQGPGTATLHAPPPAVSYPSIAGLAATCRGSDQAALICRHRICRGYWGRADACPAREEAAAARAAQRGRL